jgi:hypothetical protein
VADESDDGRTFEPISTTTLGSLGKGMLRRASTQGEGIARQIAQNYQGLANFGRSLAPRGTFGPPEGGTGRSPIDPPSEPQMQESPFAQASSDQGVRLGAHLLDPANFITGGTGALGAKAIKQVATSRALRAAAEREALATQTAAREAADPYAFLLRGGPSAQRGFMSPKLAGGMAAGGLGAWGLSRALRDDTPEDPAARTTANAFRQQQEAMDAAREELKRQSGR